MYHERVPHRHWRCSSPRLPPTTPFSIRLLLLFFTRLRLLPMSAIASAPVLSNDGDDDAYAARQLEGALHAADSSGQGYLSYSGFASVVLRCGASHEQVDALIQQFSVPSGDANPQRVVDYKALLRQIGQAMKEAAAEQPEKKPLVASLIERRTSAHSAATGSLRSSQTREQSMELSPLPMQPTHGGVAAVTRTAPLTSPFADDMSGSRRWSRSRSTTSAATSSHPTRFMDPLLTSPVRRSVSHPSSHGPTRPSASPSPTNSTDPSDLFLTTALRIAKTVSRSASSHRSPSLKSNSATAAAREPPGPTGPRQWHGRPRNELSFHTMVNQAAQQSMARESKTPYRSQSTSPLFVPPVTMSLSPATATGAAAAEPSSNTPVGPVVPEPSGTGSTLYSSSTGDGAQPALSLCDVFRLINVSHRSFVWLQEVHEALVRRGIEIHALELEAVADSLDLVSVARSPAASTTDGADSTVRVDRQVTIVDFCVLVSRLRPEFIRRIRSASLWAKAVSSRRGTGRTSSVFIEHPMDVSVSPSTVRRTASRSPATPASRLRTDHLPPATAPRVIARKLSSDLESASRQPQNAPAQRTNTASAQVPGQQKSRHRFLNQTVASQGRLRPPAHQQYLQRRHPQTAPATVAAQSGSASRSGTVCHPSLSAFSSNAVLTSSSAAEHITVSLVDHKEEEVRSPLSSSSSSPSPSPTATTAADTLPISLLVQLQSRASALLRLCTRADANRSGHLPARQWCTLAKRVCPSLSAADMTTLEDWVQQHEGQQQATAASRPAPHPSPHPRNVEMVYDYSDIIEELLTATSAKVDSSSSQGGDGSDTLKVIAAPKKKGESCTDSSPIAGKSPPASPVFQLYRHLRSPSEDVSGATAQLPAKAKAGQHGVNALLSSELMSACGGDIEALWTYFTIFDEAHSGYMPTILLRWALKELFQQTTAQAAPSWLVNRCVEVSRVPFERETIQSGEEEKVLVDTAFPPLSFAEASARRRTASVPRETWAQLSDYRYLLEEMGFSMC